jgi:hypothetical protein
MKWKTSTTKTLTFEEANDEKTTKENICRIYENAKKKDSLKNFIIKVMKTYKMNKRKIEWEKRKERWSLKIGRSPRERYDDKRQRWTKTQSDEKSCELKETRSLLCVIIYIFVG